MLPLAGRYALTSAAPTNHQVLRAEKPGTILTYVSSGLMGDEAEHFRLRAKQCRALAATARDDYSSQTLSRMAEELDLEAVTIDAETAGKNEGGSDACR